MYKRGLRAMYTVTSQEETELVYFIEHNAKRGKALTMKARCKCECEPEGRKGELRRTK